MISKEMKLTCPITLEDRIQRIRGEINAIIDAKAAAATPPSVGSASPSETCALEISCTAGHSVSIPSEAQSVTNFATVAGPAGHHEAPFRSHHLANIGAARIRACANAANTGFVMALVSA